MSGRPDYDAGDVVVCVKTRKSPDATHGIVKGGCYRAERVWHAPEQNVWVVRIACHYSDHPTGGYLAEGFRKIDRASNEFTATIRAIKPVRSTVSA